LLYRQRLTDEATCYKAMPTELYRALDLRSERFEICPETTAKLCRRGIRIHEVPVRYHPRSVADGKKIGWRDAWSTLWTLWKWRFAEVAREGCREGEAGMHPRTALADSRSTRQNDRSGIEDEPDPGVK